MAIGSIPGRMDINNGPFINNVWDGGVEKITTYSYFGGQTHSYVYFPCRYFILEIARSSGLAGIIFHLRLEGKKSIRMSCFSIPDPFLTTSYYVEKLNWILRKNRGKECEKSYVQLHWVREGSEIAKIMLTWLMNGPLLKYFVLVVW